MEAIDLNDYVAGGYYIGAYTSWTDYKDSFLPERIVSVSECRGDVTNVSWLTLDEEIYATHLVKQGLPKDKHDAARQWYDELWDTEMLFPDAFYSLSTAQEFASKFMVLREDHFIVGIGLHKSFVKSFTEENDRLIAKHMKDDKFGEPRLTNGEPFGANKIVRQQLPLEANGKPLGFEPAAYFVGFSCNYLCNVDQFAMVEDLQSYPNEYGLIDSFEIAKIVRSWRGTDDEYFPWLIVQYPLT